MSRARSVILLFVDGVGVGARDPATNPFARLAKTLLGRFHDEVRGRSGDPVEARVEHVALPLPHGGFWKPIDATLGVPGLPQSATGQATILTGVNAPQRVGRHVSAIPNRRVRELLEEDNLFRILGRAGRRATFANAFTPAFFERKRPHISATTRSLMAADIPLRRLDDLIEGRALFHDYTNASLRRAADSLRRPDAGSRDAVVPDDAPSQQGSEDRRQRAGTGQRHGTDLVSVPERSSEDAAEILFSLAREHDFVLHEHFLTDLAGHRGTDQDRLEAARRIELLVEPLARGASRHETLVLVVSDHGNLEDLTTKTHTYNPVPFLAWGPGADDAVVHACDLTDITPAILRHLRLQ